MKENEILDRIARGRTDLVFELLSSPNWKELLLAGDVRPLQWFVYYNDVTALKAVIVAGGDLAGIDLGRELGNAAFFGHWKVVDFLIANGADVNWSEPETGETPLHSALCKAGRPYYFYVVKLLVENGADVNARTIPGKSTGAFMRDVRTKGETPLHRAAAYADPATIAFLIENGAEKDVRDVNGDSPLTWASEHLRPGSVLKLLAFPPHHISDLHVERNTSDHGNGWGSGMERNLLGDYLPECGTDGD
ncbi:MAG TPA: ankyrin repeat domain-containing protein [Pyrinomonadaceae bacterium]|nr:ankyrin repeat domain-containing protein [Pyrinomonadaceae bacterium]